MFNIWSSNFSPFAYNNILVILQTVVLFQFTFYRRFIFGINRAGKANHNIIIKYNYQTCFVSNLTSII